MNQSIAVIGECMVEVKSGAAIGYGGDTLNFSVYLARLGVNVSYVSALGDDPMSDWMIKEWQDEGVDCALVTREPNAVPGLYLIDVDDTGERTFYYWRDQSPAKKIFDEDTRANALFEKLYGFDYLYLSGISLAIYSDSARQRLFDFLDAYRARGGKVLFDNNYRPRQWPSVEKSREVFEQIYRRADVALPTIDDESLLYGESDQDDVIRRLQLWGVGEMILKKGADGCTVASQESITQVKAVPVETVVDTTAAGDSFNAGFIAAKFSGKSNEDAAAFAGALAAQVVQHRGAIIDKEHMKGLVA
ncbi:MAG: sugar kinase [Gammaproteobacteria bacterium]